LLRIIKALAAEAEINLDKPAAAADILVASAEQKQIDLPSRTTVIKYLKEAAEN
jgi:hypothetical protein